MGIAAAAQAIVDELVAGGVRGVRDFRDVNPPCVLVLPPTVHYRFGKCHSGDFEVWAIVADTGQKASLDALDALTSKAQAALGGRAVTGTPDSYASPDGGTFPIYRMTWTQRITA